jgi:hypothetical protein
MLNACRIPAVDQDFCAPVAIQLPCTIMPSWRGTGTFAGTAIVEEE